MRRLAVAALALALTACSASTPPPAPVPPKPAVIALAHPPAVEAPAPKEEVTTRLLDHKYWSMSVPSNWDVTNDSEEGVEVNRNQAPGVLPAMIQVVSQPLADTSPEDFVVMMSVFAEHQVPQGANVIDVKRKAGEYNGHHASLTQVLTDKHVFLGVLAMTDEANKMGYAIVAIGPMTQEDADVLGGISRTFELKTAQPPEPEEAPAPPAPAPKKATPKKK